MNIRQKVTIKTPIQKNCKVCGKLFFGRANKLYHRECKIKLDNETAGMRRRKAQPHREAIRFNDLLLQFSYKQFRIQKKIVLFSKLISFGFKKEKYNNIVSLHHGTVIYYVCYKFSWTVNSDSDIVTILPEPLLRAMKNKEERREVD